MSTRRSSARREPAERKETPGTPLDALPVVAIARQLRHWADTVLGMAGPATDLAFGLAKARAKGPAQQAAIGKAGSMLRRMRESAGLTLQDLANALDLGNPDLIEEAERGKIALPFELILRVASVIGRGDPFTSAMKLTRAYNPELWKALEDLGMGRLVVQAGRERELANIYRGNDAARRLPDDAFADVLAFTRQAFDMAVAFRELTGSRAKRPARRIGEN